MFDDTHLGRDDVRATLPQRFRTLSETALAAVAAVVGVFAATAVATLVAPLVPGLGLVALFLGWPLGLAVGIAVVRGAVGVVAASGVPGRVRGLARDALARGDDDAASGPSECPAAADGGFTE
ncbi:MULTISPECIES: hypothetical protein [Haloferax]|uniref:Uncharacterized protein n=4 Tax=Haloferax TaxID=2251 RepID=A0A6C0UZR8_HALVO|nr:MULTISPECIES: hypothetical protein [Haloferax]ELZ75569.1 hypothetical protein C456_05438 [Haloferax lucentense DSM 14919]ELZ87035.1 hypothetical protein C452_15579 [Haloferax alexandrinus JCM 10717]MBC9987031.1 hypothetical protein [Haloferax sp. AS1]NLV03926.1 hypothetical protein [Haloferax alexandrinus]QIB79329.1 hypothetical protein G3A49_14935 [Haloferax alexandrinus]